MCERYRHSARKLRRSSNRWRTGPAERSGKWSPRPYGVVWRIRGGHERGNRSRSMPATSVAGPGATWTTSESCWSGLKARCTDDSTPMTLEPALTGVSSITTNRRIRRASIRSMRLVGPPGLARRVVPCWGAWLVAAFAAAALVALDWKTWPVDASPLQAQSIPAVQSDEQQARVTCGGCHAFSPPDILPRDAWRNEFVRMMFIRENRLPPIGPPGTVYPHDSAAAGHGAGAPVLHQPARPSVCRRRNRGRPRASRRSSSRAAA